MAYTAPDPAGPTDGSLTIGLLPPWAIAADATISPNVAANLAGLAGTGPSCVTMVVTASVITSLDFAAQGDISGSVVFDSGFGGYIFAQRLLVPTFITDAYPGLAAIFATSAKTGTDVDGTFFVDTTSGQLTGVDVRAAFCGPGHLASNGDGIIGAARLPAAVLDSTDQLALANAHSRQTCASVRTQGTINTGTGALSLSTTVRLVVAPAAAPSSLGTAPPTSTLPEITAPSPRDDSGAALAIALVGLLTLVGVLRRTTIARDRV
jgi:hypothetical protein